ncbi:uncharacterized protein FOMMEDRAFT_161019 [Fomitiporia mediterranea MF3/22]|uniref:uncharacterized protein n=1 Tax=Fomitiporia mediterranea (strain MF3/22) TaxID=694068 RepID=UPI0004408C1D|nr:uncharacterized protein FOMMEDRAFT_161019 [Fomitiporia mediterranea MF3/22]EJC98843.1 hypothetical protein FOMMEDRAFT_161019 [Fomitiporia mediterranea MF3/22]
MIPRCFALVAVALSFTVFAEALPISFYESQSLVNLPTSTAVGLSTSLPIPTETIPTDAPITSSLPLSTLTDSSAAISLTSVPIPGLLDSILSSVQSGTDIPPNQDPLTNLGDLSGSVS